MLTNLNKKYNFMESSTLLRLQEAWAVSTVAASAVSASETTEQSGHKSIQFLARMFQHVMKNGFGYWTLPELPDPIYISSSAFSLLHDMFSNNRRSWFIKKLLKEIVLDVQGLSSVDVQGLASVEVQILYSRYMNARKRIGLTAEIPAFVLPLVKLTYTENKRRRYLASMQIPIA